MVGDGEGLIAIAVMTAAALSMRLGGLLLMDRVPLTPRVEAFLQSLAGSVMIALVVPMALDGGLVTSLAVLLCVAIVVASGQVILGVAAAVLVAVAVRQLGLF